MAGLGDSDGYEGTAVLEVGRSRFDVQVRLRGHFQPIDGRYHWYGRIDAHEGLDELLGSGKASGVLTTAEGSAPCELSEPDPSHRYRVTGISTPPFRAGPGAAGQAGTAAQDGLPRRRLPMRRPRRCQATSAWPSSAPGFGGLGAAIRLRQAGVTDFVILERADRGRRHLARQHLPRLRLRRAVAPVLVLVRAEPGWSHSFSRQPEIWRYLEDVTDRLRTARAHASSAPRCSGRDWDAAAARWRLRTNRGELTADVLICASGPLSEPSLPDVPGLASFSGEVFHSSRWNHSYSLEGKRVAVVGTGASAIQIVPKIQPEVKHLVLFQRTPAWIVPRRDRRITEFEKRLYRQVPAAQRLARLGIYTPASRWWAASPSGPRSSRRPSGRRCGNLARSDPDAELRAKLTPDYVMGCKRILISSDFYPALRRPNVQVVASGLAKVDGNTLTAKDGTSCEVDAIILATGFHAVDAPIAERLYGADGRAWHSPGTATCARCAAPRSRASPTCAWSSGPTRASATTR